VAIDARRRREWISYNPILKKNDLAIDLNDNSLKLGDGQTRWSDLSVLLIKAQEPVDQADLDSAISVAVSNLVNSAPGTMDTLGELAALLSSDEDAAAALATTVSGKLAKASNLSDLEDVAEAKANLSLVKGDVGLGNVDNTADTAKPVSTAQQTVLDLKAPLASPALTGNPTAPTPSAGDNDTSIATSAFVAGEISTHVGATGAHAADKVSVTTSGLVVVTHTNVQAAIADLDSASNLRARRSATWLANHDYLAGEIVVQNGLAYSAISDFTSGSVFDAANWTLLSPGAVQDVAARNDGVAMALTTTPTAVGPSFTIPQSTQRIWLKCSAWIDVTTSAAAAQTGTASVAIMDDQGTPAFICGDVCSFENGNTTGYARASGHDFIDPNTPSRVYTMYAYKNSATSFAAQLLNGSGGSFFKSWMSWGYA